MPNTPDIDQNNKHTEEYFNQLGFDVKKLLRNKLASRIKQSAPPFDIPEIEEDEPKDKPENIGTKSIDTGIGQVESDQPFEIEDVEEIKNELQELKEALKEVALEEKINIMRETLISEFSDTIKELKTELDDLRGRKVPVGGTADASGKYKEKLFEFVINVLDSVFIELFDDIPDYSLVSTQVSRTFDDGTVSDAIVVVTVTVPNKGYRYDFKVDIPILNGIVHYPTYIQRGLKIIPLTKEKIMEELNSMSFRKLETERPYEKGNIFNNIGDNIHRRPDTQKWYDIENTEPGLVGVPANSKWGPKKIKEV